MNPAAHPRDQAAATREAIAKFVKQVIGNKSVYSSV